MKWITLFIVFIPNLCLSQPDSTWAQFYGGPSRDYGYEAISLPNGGFALAGYYTHREQKTIHMRPIW